MKISGDKLIDALDSIVFYNGHEKSIKKLITYIKSSEYEGGTIIYPEFLPKDCDTFIRTIWSILVVLFGDYGGSPRFGWINYSNKKSAIWFLKETTKTNREAGATK